MQNQVSAALKIGLDYHMSTGELEINYKIGMQFDEVSMKFKK